MHLCCPFDARRGTLDFAHLSFSPWCIRITTILYEGLQEEQQPFISLIHSKGCMCMSEAMLTLSSSSICIAIAIRHWLQHGHRQNYCGSSRHDNDNKAQETQWAPLAVQPHS
jgi:hypothetical protein